MNEHMKTKKFFYIVFLIPIILVSCEKVEIGESFECRVGDEFRVDGNLSFKIDSVKDYRCPKNLMCIWGGGVDIYVKFYKTFSTIDTLISTAYSRKNPIEIAGYTFKLLSVNPYPETNIFTPQKDYKIEMIILKN
jgi:hypothetical protein